MRKKKKILNKLCQPNKAVKVVALTHTLSFFPVIIIIFFAFHHPSKQTKPNPTMAQRKPFAIGKEEDASYIVAVDETLTLTDLPPEKKGTVDDRRDMHRMGKAQVCITPPPPPHPKKEKKERKRKERESNPTNNIFFPFSSPPPNRNSDETSPLSPFSASRPL